MELEFDQKILNRDQILQEIIEERENQDDSQDLGWSQNEWVGIITGYLGRATHIRQEQPGSSRALRRVFIKVAALCIAAIEALDKGED